MEVHGIQPTGGLKEIICSDCGHRFLVAQGQHTGACSACGNILFQSAEADPSVNELSKSILENRIFPRLERAPHPIDAFAMPADGNAVEEIRMRYQVEWQLWAALTKRFEDPVHHTAYLCQAIAASELERAAERYREHRSVMALLDDSRWQADVADLMLSRIENITVARLAATTSQRYSWPAWLMLAPLDGRVMKVAWLALGIVVATRLILLFM